MNAHTFNFTLRELALALGGEVSGNQVVAPGPGHDPSDRSMSVRPDSSAPGGFLVNTFSPADDPLKCKDYVRDKMGVRWEPTAAPRDSLARMADRVSKPVAKAGSPPATYIYKQADGTPYLRVVRPGFYQSHWSGGAWVSGAPKGPKIPYRLPELRASQHDDVLIVEGEKDAENVAALGFTVTTNPGGAGKFPAELAEHFEGKNVYILPDNDQAGEDHAKLVTGALLGVARSVRVVRLPGLPLKGDVSDWIEAGGTADDLADLTRNAPEVKLAEPPHLIQSSAEFLEGFIPPDYLIDGLVQRRFCYSLTAPTGHGKTAVALLLSASAALGRPIGSRDIEPGRVLYLAGENPDDVRMRWTALADKMDFDPETIGVHFLPGVFKLSDIGPRIRAEVERIGGVSLVVVDTSAAFFEGDEENGNVQAGAHARMMRSLVTVPGAPCVLIMCHPVKNAGQDNLLPRGGGAFLAEVDGNLTCWKTDSLVTLHWQGKFRGPDFAPLSFHLETVTSLRLKDSKDRLIPSVIARALSDKERGEAEATSRSDEDAVLLALAESDRLSMVAIAGLLGWKTHAGEPNKSKAQRLCDRLKRSKLIEAGRSGVALSPKGKEEAKRISQNAALAGSRYG